MQIFCLKWSRKLHKWLGIYVAILTVLWIAELALLPMIYPVDGVEGVCSSMDRLSSESVDSISFQELLRRLQAGSYGSYGPNVEISYFPRDEKYVVRDWDSFVTSEISAETGTLLGRQLDSNNLFAKKSGLVWANEMVGSIIKAPFEISFVILAITGVCLVFFPYPRRKRAGSEGILGLEPGERFRFTGTRHSGDMARIAALGLLPGVSATVMRVSRRGPVVLSARNTRIAVARNVAASFLFEKTEA
jgi:Fe2+ transport system protein FeoA